MSNGSLRSFLLRETEENFCYHLGNGAAAAGRFEEAITCYELALATKPDHSPAMHNLALALARLDRLAESEAMRGKAGAGAAVQAWCDLGDVYTLQGRPDEALAAYRQAVALNPQCAPALRQIGKQLSEQDPVAAAEVYDRMMQALPSHGDQFFSIANLNAIGFLLACLKRLDGAEIAFRSVETLSGAADDRSGTDRPPVMIFSARQMLAMVCAEKGAFDQAAAALAAAGRLNPGEDRIFHITNKLLPARFAVLQGDHAQAEALYRAVIAQEPDWGWTRLELAAVLEQTGRADQALTVCDQALTVEQIRRTTLEPWAHIYRGCILATLGRDAEAQAELRQGRSATIDGGFIYYSLGPDVRPRLVRGLGFRIGPGAGASALAPAPG